MTIDTITTASPAEAGQRLVDQLRRITREHVADRAAAQAAIDDFLTEVDGVDTTAVEAAAWNVIDQHERSRQHYADAGPRGASAALVALMIVVDTMAQPLAREVAAAEQTLTERERAASVALTALERAIGGGDPAEVRQLRDQVEVEHPRRIAEARTALLELRATQAAARLECTKGRPAETAQRVADAGKRRDELVAELRRAAEEATLAEVEQQWMKDARARQEAEANTARRELADFQASREREMRDRVRRIVGLPDPTPAPQPSALPRQVVQDFSPTETTYYSSSVVA
ncbi:hypothetical protein ACN267_32120 [Micromonospora sp. WMMD734]|uniref:hypothetical protein n=1 Tax=Micromonospora sp. WMMD734 TaxID=3404129 RepID=UPI003B949972